MATFYMGDATETDVTTRGDRAKVVQSFQSFARRYAEHQSLLFWSFGNELNGVWNGYLQVRTRALPVRTPCAHPLHAIPPPPMPSTRVDHRSTTYGADASSSPWHSFPNPSKRTSHRHYLEPDTERRRADPPGLECAIQGHCRSQICPSPPPTRLSASLTSIVALSACSLPAFSPACSLLSSHRR